MRKRALTAYRDSKTRFEHAVEIREHVLWNTRYMHAALEELWTRGETVLEEDVARLSSQTCGHINLLGRYHLALPEELPKGELRRLRKPDDIDTEAL
jgi:hypothetical protein